MLWTDGPFITQADMQRVDAELLSVANGTDDALIDITADTIPVSIDECGTDLLVRLQRFGGFLSTGGVSANHLAAVFNVGGPGVNRTRIALGMVVVDDQQVKAVKNWVMYVALRNFYRDVYARTKEDRYVKKMEQYEKDIVRKYKPAMYALGIPVVYRPLPRPGASLERSGTWGSSNVSGISSSGPAGGDFFVAITYVDQTQYLGPRYGIGPGTANNGESHTSIPLAVTTSVDQVISVNINGLIPPNGIADPARQAQTIVTPYNASGWNVYVGASAAGPFYLQNTTPIPIATTSYALASDPVLSGNTPNPQFADCYFTVMDQLQRG